MSNKARIIQTHAMEKFELEHASGDPIRTEGQAWAAELCDLLEVFRGYIENFSFILVQCSIDTWKRVATLYRNVVFLILDYLESFSFDKYFFNK